MHHPINVKPKGGGHGANVGHLTFITFPSHANLTESLGPRVDKFQFPFFFVKRNGTLSHVLACAAILVIQHKQGM